MQMVSQIRTWNRDDRTFFLAVLGAFRCNLTQHHFWVVNKVAVEGYALRSQPQMHPIRLDINGMVSLLQENDIRHHICTGIGTECVVWKSDGSQQFCPLCQILSCVRILGIHRIAAGNKGHDTTGTNLIQCLGKEIVVDRKSEFIIGLIADTVVAKRHIADSQIIEVAPVGGFKACHLDFCLRIQLLRNAPGDGIQFHTIQSASQHGIRQHTEEVADTHRRFQNIAFLKSHTVQCFIDCTDHGRAGVMRIQSRSPGCGIFFFRKSCFQFLIFASPYSFLCIKSICKSAPADIISLLFLFLRCRFPVLVFQGFQRVDSIHVGTEFLFGATFTEMKTVNAIVLRMFRFMLCPERFFLSRISKCLNSPINHSCYRELIQCLIRPYSTCILNNFSGIQINHHIMQVNIILMPQKSCQIFLAFRAEDRIHGIRVPKLHIEKPDFFNRKCLSVQIQRIADTIIRLHRSCGFWLHSCRLFFSLHVPAANLLQRL